MSESLTSSNKRKRAEEGNSSSPKTLEILTSTPKNKANDSKNYKFYSNNKENNFWLSESCMEVKSISELVLEKGLKSTTNNEYEVIRKPPKKKKKQEENANCFVNPALDLNAADHLLNPFEVVREDNSIVSKFENDNHCFINPCLNLNVRDSVANTHINPFEVKREDNNPVEKPEKVGIENPGLDLKTTYGLVLPCTPNINQRIDFNKLGNNDLTPSSMLSTKLVLNCDAIVPTTPKAKPRKSLSTISEELDIGEELDCYQLELENSINEAKAKNQKYKFDTNKTFKRIIEEDEGEEIDQVLTPTPTTKPINETYTKEKEENSEIQHENDSEEKPENVLADNPDVQYEEVDDDEIDFQNPAPFQRNYTKPTEGVFKQPTLTVPKKSKFGDTIRRSIRNFIHHDKSEKPTKTEEAKFEHEHEGIFSSIRHSLRRKPKTVPVSTSSLEISIISEESRTIFKENKSEVKSQSEIKPNLIRNSFRRSTKDVKKQVMKSVFQKKVEEFDLY